MIIADPSFVIFDHYREINPPENNWNLNITKLKFRGKGPAKSRMIKNARKPYNRVDFYSTQKEVIYIIFYANFILGRKLEDGISTDGKGRLTLTRIDIMQSFYGLAIGKNKGDPEAMARSTRAILKQYSEDASHDDCTIGKDSLCSFQRDKTTWQKSHKSIKDHLPSHRIINIHTCVTKKVN